MMREGSDETKDFADPSPFDSVVNDPNENDLSAATLSFNENESRSVLTVNQGFGDFDNLTELARGGMGVVYKARQKSLDRTVALKMVLSGNRATRQEIERFRTEAESAAKLDHEGIVSIYEVGQINDLPYFTMRLIDGESLESRIQKSPLAVREAASTLSKIANAIHYAHTRGVIHRDLKPANVLLDQNGEPKITDFGLAKRLGGSDLTVSGQVLGTPSYMAPEQALGRTSEVDSRSDVYALGAILYCMLTGRPPFRAATQLDTLRLVISTQPVALRLLVPNVPRDVETICLKCLEKNRDHRYQTAGELESELQRFMDSRPIKARPVGLPSRIYRWTKRNPVLSGSIATIAATILIAIYFALLFAEKKRLDQFATDSVSRLQTASPRDIPKILKESADVRQRMTTDLEALEKSSNSSDNLRAKIALAERSPELANRLAMNVFECPPEFISPISATLLDVAPSSLDTVFEKFQSSSFGSKDALRGAAALAASARYQESWASHAKSIVKALLERNSFEVFEVWMPALRPIALHLVPEMLQEYRSNEISITKKELIAELVREYCQENADSLIAFGEIATLEHFEIISNVLEANATRCSQIAMDRIHLLQSRSKFPKSDRDNEICDSLKRSAGSSHNIVRSGRFALSIDVSCNKLQSAVDAMNDFGFELRRVRCYETSQGMMATCIWRASTSMQGSTVLAELSAEEVPKRDAEFFADGFLPIDISINVRDGERKYLCVWLKPDNKPKSRTSFMLHQMSLGESGDLNKATKMGYRPSSLHAMELDGSLAVAAVLEAHPRQSENENWYYGIIDPNQLSETRRFPLVQIDHCQLSRNFIEVFRDDPLLEQVVVDDQAMDTALRLGEQLALEGYLPAVCISKEGGMTNMIWHRSLPDDESLMEGESRIANLACLVAKLGNISLVQTIFQDPSQHATSAKICERIGSIADRKTLWTQCTHARSPSEIRYWLLAIGSSSRIVDDGSSRWVRDQFDSHSDPGVHSAAEWTCHRLKIPLSKSLASNSSGSSKPQISSKELQWWSTTEKHTMIQIPSGHEFLKGSPRTEKGRLSQDECRHWVRIPRCYAIAAHEVSVEQFMRFKKDYQHNSNWARTPDCPAGSLNWYEAANYCNWLSEKEGIPKEQWCYPESFKPGESLKKNMLDLEGYRLPTEAEWEFACRAGTQTAYHFGNDASLLPAYSNFRDSSDWHAWPIGSKKPNAYGLFDVYGNAFEWCHDVFSSTVNDGFHILSDIGGPPFDESNPLNLFRGGSVEDPPNEVRSACRNRAPRFNRISGSGFRICKTVSTNLIAGVSE